MNQEQNNVPVVVTSDNQQVVGQPLPYENQEVREYYLRQLRLMCPTIATDISDNAQLAILKKRTGRLVEMLTLFEHSWTEEMPVMQKACLSYLTMENIPRKERQELIDAWADWTDFQFKLARYRGLLTQFLQYHHRVRQELESLQNPVNPEESPETNKTDQKGGI